jgi:uncharacterized repeat protein (TIGR01451 family)
MQNPFYMHSVAFDFSSSEMTSAPIALNDDFTGIEDTPMTLVGITANDMDDDGVIDLTTIDLDPTQPGQQTTLINAHGTYSLTTASGEITFVPALNWNGTTSIAYTVMDDSGNTSNVAYIYIVISEALDAPVAMDDFGYGTEDDPYINVSMIHINDFDPEGQGFIVGSIDINPMTLDQDTYYEDATGVWMVDVGYGIISFFPNPDFHGTTMIGYTIVSFTNMLSNVAMVSIEVQPANDAPVAQANSTLVNTGLVGFLTAVVADDFDLENNIQTSTIDLDPVAPGLQASTTTLDGAWTADIQTGDVTFNANAGFSGTSSIFYVVSDSLGLTSNQAALTVHLLSSNNAPYASADHVIGNEDAAYIQVPMVSDNDSDPDGNEQLVVSTIDIDQNTAGQQIALTNTFGNWTLDINTGTITYIPLSNFSGLAEMWYTIQDVGGLVSAPAQITVQVAPQDDNPVASADSTVTQMDVVCFIENILDNDYDLENNIDSTTVDLNLELAGIQYTYTNEFGDWEYILVDEKVQYTPPPGFIGLAMHEYSVQDMNGMRALPAPLFVDVQAIVPPNGAPVPNHLQYAQLSSSQSTLTASETTRYTQAAASSEHLLNASIYSHIQHSTHEDANMVLVKGSAYYDANRNCKRDQNEQAIAHMRINVNDGSHLIGTDATGAFVLPLQAGMHTMKGFNNTYWKNNCTATYEVIDSSGHVALLDVPFVPLVEGYDLAVHLSGLAWEHNSTQATTITIENVGTQEAAKSTLRLTYPDGVSIIDASIPWTYQDGQDYVWELAKLPLSASIQIKLIDAVSHSTEIGDFLRVTASLSAEGMDLGAHNNSVFIDREIVPALSSNVIHVSPKGEGIQGLIDRDQTLTYTSQFQNTGIQTSQTLHIENTLPTNLNIESLEMIGATADYSYVLTDQRHLTIFFRDIALPSAALSSVESQGAISYRIRTASNAEIGEAIENKATLYFDRAEPISTKEALNTLRRKSEEAISSVKLWPNPASDILHIGLNAAIMDGRTHPTLAMVEIMDIRGQVVLAWQQTGASQLDFSTMELRPGQYQVRVLDDVGQVHHGRFVVSHHD